MGFLSDQISVWMLAGICLFGSLAGCGQTNPSTFPVAGQVLLDGQPLEGAAVMLKPVAGGATVMVLRMPKAVSKSRRIGKATVRFQANTGSSSRWKSWCSRSV